MAFSSTLVKRYLTAGPCIREVWDWVATGVTTGTITPDTNDVDGLGLIKQIDLCPSTVTSTDAALVLTYPTASRATVTVTCGSGSAGTITIEGIAQ